MRWLLPAVLLLGFASPAAATPGASTWFRQTLLGENGTHYFLLETRWVNYGSHYQHTEYQRVIRIDKRSDSVVDTTELRKTVFTMDPNTWTQRIEEQSTAAFDWARYIRTNSIRAPFTVGTWAKLDETGIYVEHDQRRLEVLPIAKIRSRFPPGGEVEEMSLIGAEFTSAIADTGIGRMIYLRVSSYPAGSDVDGSEIILMVPWKRLTDIYTGGDQDGSKRGQIDGSASNRPLQRTELRVTRLAKRQQAARRSAGPLNG